MEASQRYADRKNRPQLLPKLTHDSIRLTHAIMYMTGYITPSNRRMYWQRRGDTMNMQVKKAMSETTFSSIIQKHSLCPEDRTRPKGQVLEGPPPLQPAKYHCEEVGPASGEGLHRRGHGEILWSPPSQAVHAREAPPFRLQNLDFGQQHRGAPRQPALRRVHHQDPHYGLP